MRASRLAIVVVLPFSCLSAGAALAQYAEPPTPVVVYHPVPPEPVPVAEDTPPYVPPGRLFRLETGPALRLSDATPAGGLLVALDVGRRAAGVRASAAWMGVGQRHGASQYTGELWLDFGFGRRLHPVLGAGGGLAVIDVEGATGDLGTANVGVGVLRGGLSYVLPVRGEGARAGVELTGVLPAIHGSSEPTVNPWAMAVAAVSIGF